MSALRTAVLGVAAALITGAAAISLPTAASAEAVGCDQVHLGPAPASGAGYFAATLAAGESAGERLVVANPAAVACTVRLSPAAGRTALNSGDTYAVAAHTWVHGLPAAVTIPAGRRSVVDFRVTVPAGAAAGQHLFGVVGSPVSGGAAAPGAGVSLGVSARVAIGVAVTVPGAAVARVAIDRVETASDATAASLRIAERNDGAMWEHPRGTVTVLLPGRTIRIPVASNTVLPGDRAVLAVAATAVPAGTYPVAVRLTFEGGAAHWKGALTFAPPQVVRAGDRLTVTTAAPAWITATIGVLGALLAAALLAVLVLWRRRPRAASA